MNNFRKELESLINKNSLENESDTPDYILSEFLIGCLNAFDAAVNKRKLHTCEKDVKIETTLLDKTEPIQD